VAWLPEKVLERWVGSVTLILSGRASIVRQIALFGEPGLDQRLVRRVAFIGGDLDPFQQRTGKRRLDFAKPASIFAGYVPRRNC
jgi:hypothetical protein